MYTWDLLHSLFGQQRDRYCFAAPYVQLVPESFTASHMQSNEPRPCSTVWKDTFKATGDALLEDDLPEDTAYQHEGKHYMYRGTIPEFTILASNNVQLSSTEELEQFLSQELQCFSMFFEQLTKFDLKLNQLLSVSVHDSHQYQYLYKFQPRPEKRYYDLYLDWILQHTQMDKPEREELAKQWAKQRHTTLSQYAGYYEYAKTTYSFEGALYSVEQMLRHQWSTDKLPELVKRFQQKVEMAKNLVWDSEHYLYIENVIRDYIHRHYFDSPLLHGKAQDVVLADLTRCAWRKIRSYQGNGQFRGFIKKVIQNKINDMWIEIQGKHRPPMWVVYKEKEDPIYKAAYEILLRKQHSKQEALSILMIHYPEKEKQFVRDVIDDVLKNCPAHNTVAEVGLVDDDSHQDASDIEKELEQLQLDEILEQLKMHFLEFKQGSDTKQLLAYFEKCIDITDEDKLILRMKYLTGLTQQQIADALNTSVSTINRRLKKILGRFRGGLDDFVGVDE
ncbi:sigma-70 family RNA polymerase sigma factor [Candidatus Albibeggiatoa sp. nov. NOAA]|uniref:RNA polymerase sigma factor n=1 Tax=Candidatus Albibeggiatoa sp. nov. NOAA TaxID=3162724 RepID=UPI003301D9B4|nr:sigma-70 family RNA polymerase sigma factor [Thiotrichaceae bacterium]